MPTRAVADADERRRIQEVAHELRTPLAVTATNLDLVTGVGTSPDDARRYLAAARRAIDRMARTVDDLDAHGGLAFDPADTRAIDLAAEASELVAEHAGPAGVRECDARVDALEGVIVASTAKPSAPLWATCSPTRCDCRRERHRHVRGGHE